MACAHDAGSDYWAAQAGLCRAGPDRTSATAVGRRMELARVSDGKNRGPLSLPRWSPKIGTVGDCEPAAHWLFRGPSSGARFPFRVAGSANSASLTESIRREYSSLPSPELMTAFPNVIGNEVPAHCQSV
jgi:hypothetical protein